MSATQKLRYQLLCIFSCLSLLCMTFITHAEQPKTTTIRVGVLANGWGPFQQINDQITTGFSVELIQLLAKNLNYQIDWKVYPNWMSLYSAGCNGEVDVLLDAFRTVERTQCLMFSRSYYTSPTVVVIRYDSRFFRDVSEFGQARIAVEKGFSTEKLVKLHYPTVTEVTFSNTEQALSSVIDKTTDAYIGNLHVANQYISAHPELLIVAQAPLMMENLHLGITKNNSLLVTQLDNALMALSVEERNALEVTWLGMGDLHFLGHSNFLLRPNEREWLAGLPSLRVGFVSHWMPFSSVNNKGILVGLLADYLEQFREKLGLDYAAQKTRTWDEIQTALVNHEIDLAIIPTRLKAQYPDWHMSEVFTSFPIVIATARNSPRIAGLSELNFQRVVITDNLLLPSIKKAYPNIDVVVSANPDEGLTLVAKGKAAAYIGNLAVVTMLIDDKFDDELRVAAPTPYKDELAVAVREPYWPLIPLINRVFSSMSEKEKQQIRNTWLAVNYSEGISWHTLLKTLLPIAIGLLLFIGGLTIAYLKLRQEINKRRIVENALAIAKENAEQATKRKAEFLAAMSHEIRTPMNGLVGMAEQLSFTPLGIEQKQMVQIISNGAKEILQIINNILDFSKIDMGKMRLESTPILLREVLDSTLNMVMNDLRTKGLSLYLHVDQGVAARVTGDSLRIKQILFNWVNNAIKFTERGFIEVSVKLEAEQEGQQLLLIGVQDTGIGMNTETQARIFNIFEQADVSTTRSYGGAGLGLAISHTLAEMMGGDIILNSAPHLGTFIGLRIRLPVVAQNEFDEQLQGLKAYIAIGDIKLRHTLSWHLASLGIVLTENKANADLLFTDNASDDRQHILCTHFNEALGYRYQNEQCLLNANPLTSQAVKDICYINMGWIDTIVSTPQRDIQFKFNWPECKILLVEDHQLNQILVQRQLKQLRLTCDIADNGAQALALMQKTQYDLVLCDCRMPVMDGYTFCQQVRSQEIEGQHIPIIALTANVLNEQKQRCMAVGMDDLLAKPLHLDELYKMLLKWLPSAKPALIDIKILEDAFGREETLSKMLLMFKTELETSLQDIQLKTPQLADKIHRCAGTISMLGLTSIAEHAWILEEKMRQQGNNNAEAELAQFQTTIAQLITELDAIMRNRT
ncbi:response regulator [Shewanella oncorhynchi]|uniref:response regulator n=1 Tax=Shewanella oncorhynchi TaxID=2726434 RepID=UPI003D7BE9CD